MVREIKLSSRRLSSSFRFLSFGPTITVFLRYSSEKFNFSTAKSKHPCSKTINENQDPSNILTCIPYCSKRVSSSSWRVLDFIFWFVKKRSLVYPRCDSTTFLTSPVTLAFHFFCTLIAIAQRWLPVHPSVTHHLSEMDLSTGYVSPSTLPSPPPSGPV